MNNLNERFEGILKTSIQRVNEIRTTLEENKDFRRLPYSVKKPYYEQYDYLMEELYNALHYVVDYKEVLSFEDYSSLMNIDYELHEYVKTILETYGINCLEDYFYEG